MYVLVLFKKIWYDEVFSGCQHCPFTITQKKLYLLTLQNIRNVPDQSNYMQVYTLQYLYIVNKYQASIWYKMFFSDKSSLQELSIYLFKKTWIEKSFFLGKKEMHILIFHSFLVGLLMVDSLCQEGRRRFSTMQVHTTTMCDVESRVLRSFILGV